MRVGVTGKLVVKMNIPVAVRNATTLSVKYINIWTKLYLLKYGLWYTILW